jgi:hypothetical protein
MLSFTDARIPPSDSSRLSPGSIGCYETMRDRSKTSVPTRAPPNTGFGSSESEIAEEFPWTRFVFGLSPGSSSVHAPFEHPYHWVAPVLYEAMLRALDDAPYAS